MDFVCKRWLHGEHILNAFHYSSLSCLHLFDIFSACLVSYSTTQILDTTFFLCCFWNDVRNSKKLMLWTNLCTMHIHCINIQRELMQKNWKKKKKKYDREPGNYKCALIWVPLQSKKKKLRRKIRYISSKQHKARKMRS